MNREDVAVDIYCRRKGPLMDNYDLLGVPVTEAGWLPLWRAQPTFRETVAQFLRVIPAAWKARDELRALSRRVREEFDVVHVNYESLLPVALWLKLTTKKPQVHHCRARIRRTPWGRVHVKVASLIADRLIFITENERDHFCSLGGRIGTVIYNPAPESKVVSEPSASLPDDGRLKVMSLSNYSHDRGVDRVGEVARSLKNSGRHDILFIMVGDMHLHLADPGRLGEIARNGGELSDYANAEGVSDMFMFLGHVAEPEVLICQSDVVVKFSRFDEPWGRDVIEAMSFGAPVLATGTWQGFVEHDQNGLLFSDFKPDDVASALAHLADDRSLVRKMGERARQRIKKLCDPKLQAEKIVAEWQSALATH